MRRLLLLMLTIVVSTMVLAGDVTPQQAWEKAKEFMQSREVTGSRRAHGSLTQKGQTSRVNGLYVFNVSNNGGFVIVSNDDRTYPILGFSDTGNLDLNNMPDNMRAWLQGYADEIAWLQQQNVIIPNEFVKVRKAGAPRRSGSHSTAAVTPLLTTTWNQGTPYNNLCPEYSSGKKSATGCVATAMAQVMNYHQWPTSATEPIPGYTTRRYGITLSALPATTFDWANMKDDYSGNYTSAQATAVATLMQYCGWSLQMDYGPESGADTKAVADALKNYFGYNATTTKCVYRSYYTADKWADLIYHEVASGRPVVYGGVSLTAGHEFVCDGYKYESETDFFHINWGWGGLSDEYFVLSALDPDQQGIGGSTSPGGYCYGQDAVIGIQKSTENGDVADITPNVINLSLNSMTAASNTTPCYMPVDVTLNITNNSADDYDGDIYLAIYDNGWRITSNGQCNIPAGATKDVVVKLYLTEAGSYLVGAFGGDYRGIGSQTITVTATEAETNGFVPVYGYYSDNYSRSQFIIPAANLTDMENCNVNAMTFYAYPQLPIGWGNAKFDVYLKEVSETTFANTTLKSWSTLEKVYAGSLSIDGDGKMTVTFNTPYQYKGGNLLVGINQTTKGTYKDCQWVGQTAAGASLGGYNTNISQQNFLPLTTFDYESVEDIYPSPTDVAVSPDATKATVTWTGNDEATGYNLRYRTTKSISYDFESAEPWAVDDFSPFTTYDGDGLRTYTIEGSTFTNQGYTGSLIAFQNGASNGFTSHSGNAFGAFMDAIPSGSKKCNNDWFISPEVEVTPGMVFSFWARSHTNQYGLERFKVGVCGSTNGTFASYLAGSANTYVEAPIEWTKYEYDLSAYAGQTVKLAINCVSADAFALFIDDIYIGNSGNSWDKTIENVTTPYELTGLTPETPYELQVQAVYANGTSNWTAATEFTTLAPPTLDDAVLVTAPAAVADLIYTGEPLTLVTAGVAEGGEVQYTLSADGEFSATLPTATAAGSYTVYYKVVGDDSHNSLPVAGPINVSIGKAAGTISYEVTNVNKTFGDAPFTNPLNIVGDGTVRYSSDNTNVATVNGISGVVTIKSNGSANIKATVTDGANYTYATKTVTYTIDVEAATMTIAAEGFTGNYDGQPHGISVEITNPEGAVVKYGTVSGNYNLNSSPTYTDAGDYTVYYQVTKKGYATVENSAVVSISKAAAAISYAMTEVDKIDTDIPFINELTMTGDGTVTYSSDNATVATVDSKTGEVTITGIGEAKITATVADGTNYTYSTKTAHYMLTVTADPTGIDSISIASDDMNATWYDLKGRKLQGKPAPKGVYLRNGKTVVIK